VKDNRISSIEELYLHSLPVKEHQMVDQIFPGSRTRC
jgi:small subunit ribosomal protein S2e